MSAKAKPPASAARQQLDAGIFVGKSDMNSLARNLMMIRGKVVAQGEVLIT
jgi:hypothetical protein